MAISLGIDTGGTYTDAVIVDSHLGVQHAAKALTTRHDLAQGIAEAIAQLPQETFTEIKMVSLSTTLATNSVVEGYGAKVCVILAGYSESDLRMSRIDELMDASPCVLLAGSHNAAGVEDQVLDKGAARVAIETHKNNVSAFAISGYFSVRNPRHELQLAEMVHAICQKPVTCGHELASGLDAPRRALTAALNARMSTYIHELMHAVKLVLERYKIDAPMMVVKGDGTLINVKTATQRPIETILSGPAASVIGACYLSGKKNAIVADMGGTTTDIAIVENGRVDTSAQGSVIAGWRPMIEAVKVYSIGLGGDSEVRFKPGSGITAGPRRVVPMSLLCFLYPQLIGRLRIQNKASVSPRQNKFALRFQHDPVLLSEMSSTERQVWELLEHGPLELESMVMENRSFSRAIAKMHRKGLLIYSGFTPSDAAHVLSLTDHWNKEAAALSALIWARQMRRLYGYGKWQSDDAIGPSRSVLAMVSERISEMIIKAGLNQFGIERETQLHQYSEMLSDLLFSKKQDAANGLFNLQFAKDYPLVGVGAPAHCYFPVAADRLKIELLVPDFSDVANAVGAVAGQVMQTARILITQSTQGEFSVHTDGGVKHLDSLQQAYNVAEDAARSKAQKLAIDAGADKPRIEIHREENSVNHAIDGFVFFESTVIATAIGAPLLFDPHNCV